ncbi:MAG: hypothetical protein ACRDRF_17410 [Pseudonocardiaceae bacterium]
MTTRWRHLAITPSTWRARRRRFGGWPAVREEFAERMIDTLQVRAPGFRSTIVRRTVRTPQDMVQELRWPAAHPMSLAARAVLTWRRRSGS